MSIYEYDAEKHMRQEREAEFERGVDVGIEKGELQKLLKLIQKKLELGSSVSKIAEDLVESEEIIRQLIEEHKLISQ